MRINQLLIQHQNIKQLRRAKTMRQRRAMNNGFEMKDSDMTNDNHAHSLDAKQLAEVITGNKKSIFFQFGESLIDIRSEKHLIGCFEANSQWKKDPINHIYTLQLFFALNLKWKFYVLCALFVKEFLASMFILTTSGIYLWHILATMIKLLVITIACKFFLQTMKKYQKLKSIKVMNQQDSGIESQSTIQSNMDSKLQRMGIFDQSKTQHIPIEADLPFVKACRLLHFLCFVILAMDGLRLWIITAGSQPTPLAQQYVHAYVLIILIYNICNVNLFTIICFVFVIFDFFDTVLYGIYQARCY